MPLAESESLLESLHLEHAVLHVGRGTGGRKSDPEPSRPPFRVLVETTRARSGSIPPMSSSIAPEYSPLPTGWVMGTSRPSGKRRPGHTWRMARTTFSASARGTMPAEASLLSVLVTLRDRDLLWLHWRTSTRPPGCSGCPAAPGGEPLRAFARPLPRTRPSRGASQLAGHPLRRQPRFPRPDIPREVTWHGPDRGFRVAGRSAGQPATWEVERVISAVGIGPTLACARACWWMSLRVTGRPGSPGITSSARAGPGLGFPTPRRL